MISLSGLLEPDALDRRNLSHPAVGGVILFARNFESAEQLRMLNAEVRKIAGRKIVIAADQEGGRVQRFAKEGFSVLPSAAEAFQAGVLREAGLVMAAEMIAAGLDLSFAPVLDLSRGRSKIIGNRAFANTPVKTADAALQFAEGMGEAGMMSCGKHFPGHGYAVADSHTTLPQDRREFARIAEEDLVPFAKWAQHKMPALMSAHIQYPKCDSHAATFSSFWVKKVLRKQLKFGGLLVSDDLTMAGADIGDIGQRVQAAAKAGCDATLICKADAAAEALSRISRRKPARHPWLALAARSDNRVCVGDSLYQHACRKLQEHF